MRASTESVRVEPLRFRARDGYELAGELHVPAGEIRAAVLIASAMAVPRKYYAGFASFLAEAGLLTLAFDYRGIGGSRPSRLPGFQATLDDWVDLDLAAAGELLRERAGDLPRMWVGHSIGAQLFGLYRGPEMHAALFVGGQHGHHTSWSGLGRVGIWSVFHVLIPGLVPLLGHVPGRFLGGKGEDIPAGAALQWAEWGRDPDYVLGHARRKLGIRKFDFPRAICTWSFEDDRYAPREGVERLLNCYGLALKEHRHVRPEQLGVKHVGHFGPFRPRFRDTLWAEQRKWLLDQLI